MMEVGRDRPLPTTIRSGTAVSVGSTTILEAHVAVASGKAAGAANVTFRPSLYAACAVDWHGSSKTEEIQTYTISTC